MYFMDKEKQLVGKTIAFTNMAQFAEYILIVTTDGGILGVYQELEENDDCEKETVVMKKHTLEKYLFENDYFINELVKKNIITQQDIINYKEQRKKEIEEANRKYMIQKEEYDKQNYERLKSKFENK